MDNIYIILVEPIYSGNVGAVARIMNNFRFTHLRIVGSIPDKNDYYLAMHSEDILETAELFPDLGAAVADLDRVVAFSRRIGKTKPIDMSPRKTAQYVHQLKHLKIGLVFGRETFGLTDIEADLCPLRCHIPANPDFPSINLAQAVAIAVWELHGYPIEKDYGLKAIPHAASMKDIAMVKNYMIDVMKDVGYFRSWEHTNWEAFFDKLFHQLNPNKTTLYRFRQMFNRFHVLVTGKGKGYPLNDEESQD
ncbi:MAG: tRNA methyltransferase [Candidatus Cloacimonetes bacterium HGW-Cloacimonetes-1]|jgi:TrmH family RNA methyltransferase|nr:MAG: tRNA methyltransferase [Candidatus Cloacimonetes bacterium HGW-Cloacimonetes-1]